jgi:hypothetical protein
VTSQNRNRGKCPCRICNREERAENPEDEKDKDVYANYTNYRELASQARHNMDALTELFASRNVVILMEEPGRRFLTADERR